MKLGMNMMLWSFDVTDESFHATFEMLAEAGYDGIEVPIFALDEGPYAKLGGRLAALGLERTALTAPGFDSNPISQDAGERKRAIERNARALECAAAVGATILGGTLQATPTVFSGVPPTDAERHWAVEALRALAVDAGALDITLALESLNHFEHYLTTTAAETAELCVEVDHPRCRMLYDTFHAHMEEKDVRSAIRGAAEMIAYVHLSESDRSTPGTAQVAWEATFETLHEIGYDGWLTVEAFGVINLELSSAMKIFRKKYESDAQLARDAAAFARGGWTAAA